MKMALILFLFPLFLIGVFGDDVESVSVMKEDSVTLHTGRNINKDEVFEWKHGDLFFAKVNCGKTGKIIVSVNETVKGRVEMDNQTGDLKIIKIKDSDSGHYKLFIEESPSKEFSLIVPGVDEVKSVSAIVGDSVTLNSSTIIQRDDVIQWRFADLNSPIAEHNRKTGNFSTSDGPDGIFRHRLQLDYLTGSLTIRNITNHHSGLYEAGIRKSGSGYTVHQSYNVTVTGERKPALSVMKGDSVTLHTGLTEIHTDDIMQWIFEDTVIAEINKAHKQVPRYDDVPEERFRDRLKLDDQTGSLTITGTTNTDSGHYELKIISSRFTINKRISVTVSGMYSGTIAAIVLGVLLACAAAAAAGVFYHRHKISELNEWIHKERILSVMEGEDITLTPDHTDVHKGNTLVWMFRSARIAEKNSSADSFTGHDDAPDGRFKGRLKPDHKTGSLTITNTRTTDSGVYELMIIKLGKSSIKRFNVSVFVQTSDIKPVSVKEGGSVTLPSGVTDTKTVNEILWTCGLDTLLAEITGETKEISPLAAGIFQDRLKLDHQTGSLTINKIKPTDAGIYMQRITRGGNISTHLFRVSVSVNNPEEKTVTMDNSENVPLNSVETSPDSRL